jgi:hypothetical protein
MSFLKKLFNRQETNNVQETNSATPPSAEDLEKAKKIFFDHSCDHSAMRYEGSFDNIKSIMLVKNKKAHGEASILRSGSFSYP